MILFTKIGKKSDGMIIPKKQMQKIAEEVGAMIHRNVNIMDEQGIIIASTDRKRIGAVHAGAEELLRKNLPEFIVEKEGHGVYSGVNLPLIIEDRVIGVVGITGPVGEVRVLGNVIKKMTEILILDRYRRSQKQALEELRRGFVLELLFGEDEGKLEVESEMLKIDIKRPKILTVLEIDAKPGESEERREMIENTVSKIRKEMEKMNNHISARVGERIISVFDEEQSENIVNVMSTVVKNVGQQDGCRLCCGIGGPGTERNGIRRSYREADQACTMAKVQKKDPVRVYNGADLPLLLMDIPYKKREAFVNGIFQNCDEHQKKEMIQCLKSYIENNGSISKVSEELFVHKNTLQYRLTKMKTLTGYDPRVLREAVPLVVAVLLEELAE